MDSEQWLTSLAGLAMSEKAGTDMIAVSLGWMRRLNGKRGS